MKYHGTLYKHKYIRQTYYNCISLVRSVLSNSDRTLSSHALAEAIFAKCHREVLPIQTVLRARLLLGYFLQSLYLAWQSLRKYLVVCTSAKAREPTSHPDLPKSCL
jgi:hypothetical protein